MRPLLLFLIAATAAAQPLPLDGIAHVGFRVSDLDKARLHYTAYLGFQQAFAHHDDAGNITLAFFKINDDQYLELSPTLAPNGVIRFTHLAFLTPDLEAVRRILESRGLHPPPAAKGRDGNIAFSLRDPDNQRIEFVQYLPGSLHSNARGKFLDQRRISDHLQHAGVTVPRAKLDDAVRFYHTQLGFEEFWRLDAAPGKPRLIKLLIPGKRRDIIELMIHDEPPTRAAYGSMHHINFEVPEITAPYQAILERGANDPRIHPVVNAENIWAFNLYGPDGTRTEIQDLRKVPNLPLAIAGLDHGHVAGFFNRNLRRYDMRLVGIAEPDSKLSARYAGRYKIDPSLFYTNLEEMLDKTRPKAVMIFSNTFDHLRIVQACAARGIHVMMEKPLAVSLEHARAIEQAARQGHIQVLVNYETTWYRSNHAAYALTRGEKPIGDIRKIVVHDGHQGPREIGVPPEFLAWLTDPRRNGAGALFDFGCYGADLITWLMNGRRPLSVTAVTQTIKPQIYPHVDDEATIIVRYPHAQGIIQASWNWPYSRKDMEVYGETGSVITLAAGDIRLRLPGKDEETLSARHLDPRYDDPVSYFTAVLRGEIQPDGLSALPVNIIATEILVPLDPEP